jgi:hypothetical protein
MRKHKSGGIDRFLYKVRVLVKHLIVKFHFHYIQTCFDSSFETPFQPIESSLSILGLLSLVILSHFHTASIVRGPQGKVVHC